MLSLRFAPVVSSCRPMTYYTLPYGNPAPWWKRSVAATTVAGLHVIALLAAFGLVVRPDLARPLQALSVRMIETAPVPPRVEPARPQPAAPLVPPRRAPVVPPPIMTAAAPATTASSFTVAPQAEPGPIGVPSPSPPTPPAIISARFDADYLQNPKPVYPALSRRRGEEGKVVLRVRVSAQGLPLSVEIRQSSGFERLDEAARTAVERWRFVPARQGSEAIEASVLVPLHFSLDNRSN